MLRFVATLMLAAALIGCSSDDIISFNPQALVDNFETSVDTHQLMSEYGFAASRGEIDFASLDYDYVPPDDQGNPGTLTIRDGDFPFGTGDLVITFTAEGDAGFVDPYENGIDLSDDSVVTIVADVAFSGTTPQGQTLGALADFTVETVQNDINSATTTVNGNFAVAVDDYVTDFTATQLYHNTHTVLIRLIAQLGDTFNAFILNQFGNTLDQARLVNLVRQLGDDNGFFAGFLVGNDFSPGTHVHTSPARAVGFTDAARAIDDRCSR